MGERCKLNFLLVEGDEAWYARCLEYDFVTQADTLQNLYNEIERTVLGHLMISAQMGRAPFEGLRRAGREYWEMFERSQLRLQPRKSDLRAIPPGSTADLPTPEVEELRVAAVS